MGLIYLFTGHWTQVLSSVLESRFKNKVNGEIWCQGKGKGKVSGGSEGHGDDLF